MGQAKQRGTFEERKRLAIISGRKYFSFVKRTVPFTLADLVDVLPTPMTKQEKYLYEKEAEEVRRNNRKARRQNLKMKWTALLYNYWKQKRLGRA